jgi:capsular polysaccharide biosynthesis protein
LKFGNIHNSYPSPERIEPVTKGKDSLEVRIVLSLIRKWFWLIGLACLIGGGAGLVVDLLEPKIYQAQTLVYITTPNHSDVATVTGDQQIAAAFASIPQSGSVLAATLQSVNDSNLNTSLLSSMITVVNNRDTQFDTIQVRDSNPVRAANLATEITRQAVIQFNTATADGSQSRLFVQQEMDKLEIDIKNLENELTVIQQQVGFNTPSLAQTNLTGQFNTNLNNDRQLYYQMLNSYTNTSITQAIILQGAQIPKNPTGGGRSIAVAMGVVTGLIVIIAVILFIEQKSGIWRPRPISGLLHDNATSITINGTSLRMLSEQGLSGLNDLNLKEGTSKEGHKGSDNRE